VCIQLKPLFSRHKGIGVQFTDEPTGNLDQQNGQAVIELLAKLRKHFQQTIILVTHDKDIAAYADEIVHIQDGQIVKR
jgi:hypothetical protein